MPTKTLHRPLLPDALSRPIYLFWTLLLPQALLLFLNLRAWDLVHEELETGQVRKAVTLFVFQLVLLAAGSLALVVLQSRKRPVGALGCLAMLLSHIGYLWAATAWMGELLPPSVTVWMLPETQFLYHQFGLVMPALFYAGLRLACFRPRVHIAADVGATMLVLVSVPVSWFLGLHIFGSMFRSVDVPVVLTILFFTGSTVVLLVAFLRLLLFAYTALSKLKGGWFILPLAAGIAAPIGGLILNHAIPFPYDFQSHMIYGLTLLNGAALLLPFRKDSPWSTAVWMLRSATYSFTLYFFIVFLPFLPLSLLAMLAMGAGFLILAPTLLFVIHTRKLLDEGRVLAARLGRGQALALFALCLAIMPGTYVLRAKMDRHALMSAIDTVYSPDYSVTRTPLNRSAVQRSLKRLQKMKAGIYVPFLSEVYNEIVFAGMVLPDHKMEHLHKVLFGAELEPEQGGSDMLSEFFGTSRGRSWRQPTRTRLPERKVDLTSTEVTPDPEDQDTTSCWVTLRMQNQGGAASEFVTDIQLPDEVLVSGYWLDVEGERVPGRLFERKSAMWVYHMLRDSTRRDPGLLVYRPDGTLRLSVYPFNRGQTRETAIRFTFPGGQAPTIRIGDRAIALAATPAEPSARPVHVQDDAIQRLVLSSAAARDLPAMRRTPYFHFVVDRSLGAKTADLDVAATIRKVAAAHPAIATCQVTFANYETRDLGETPFPLDELDRRLADAGPLPLRGGFWVDRAIKSALLAHGKRRPSPGERPDVPVFVVLRAPDTAELRDDDTASLAQRVPDAVHVYTLRPDGAYDRRSLDDQPDCRVSTISPPPEVVVVATDDAIAACRADRGGVISLPGARPPALWDPASRSVVPFPALDILPASSAYAMGLELHAAVADTVARPFTLNEELADIVDASRDSGILVPLTSYIVVENSAQWKMLERAQKKALGADHALEFDEFQESPAPPILLLIPVVFLLLRRKRR